MSLLLLTPNEIWFAPNPYMETHASLLQSSKDLLLLIPLLAALWGLCTIVFNAVKELNSLRDRIVFGDRKDFVETLPHRTMLAKNDWLPLHILLDFVCITFGAIALAAPEMAKDAAVQPALEWARYLPYFVAACSFAMFLALFVTGIVEWRWIRKALTEQFRGKPAQHSAH